MSLDQCLHSFPWSRYSKKLKAKMTNPHSVGRFFTEESEARGMFLAEGCAGKLSDGNLIHLFWLVDKEDGLIVDAKFQLFGHSALIGAAEVVSELVVGKHYEQAKRMSTDLIDKHVRDHSNRSAFPKETFSHLNLVLEAVEDAAESADHLPKPINYTAPPAPHEIGDVLEGGYPGFAQFSKKEKLGLIESVLTEEVKPYIALDGGGVEVVNLIDQQLIIRYQGNCTSCFSAVGATLSYIQQVIRAKVHPDIEVVPDFDEAAPF